MSSVLNIHTLIDPFVYFLSVIQHLCIFPRVFIIFSVVNKADKKAKLTLETVQVIRLFHVSAMTCDNSSYGSVFENYHSQTESRLRRHKTPF